LKPLKDKYKNEGELIDEFCSLTECSECNGSDDTGEPNGYGCEAMEKFVEENISLIEEEKINDFFKS